MAAPKLSSTQREQLLTWLAADYTSDVILHWMAQQRTDLEHPEPWPELTKQALSYYRTRNEPTVSKLRSERHAAALDNGLALKAERIQRLKEHADALEIIKWDHDEKGRLWNEKAWREVLDDIAKEMGHRRQGVDVTLERELEAFLDRLRDNLDEQTYARVLALAAGAATSES